MTKLLERAFAEAAKLPPAEQDILAYRLLNEIGAEDDFDRAIAASGAKLSRLAAETRAEHCAGLTVGPAATHGNLSVKFIDRASHGQRLSGGHT